MTTSSGHNFEVRWYRSLWRQVRRSQPSTHETCADHPTETDMPLPSPPLLRVCFVCLGNICRSPTAHGIFAHLIAERGLGDRIAVESAGTGAWHLGEAPDARSVATARAHGVALRSRARRFVAADFARFDLVLAMDRDNRRELLAFAPDGAAQAKVRLLRSFDPSGPRDAEVPDPYYGGDRGFEEVFDICLAACRGLLGHLEIELAADRTPP